MEAILDRRGGVDAHSRRPGHGLGNKKRHARMPGRALLVFIAASLVLIGSAYLTRSMYSPVRVSIRIFSPGPTKGGTWTFSPVSSKASLYWLVAVAPLIEGGVSVTVRSIEAGTSIDTALPPTYCTVTLW